MNLSLIILVSCGAGVGAVARFFLSKFNNQKWNTGTLLANFLGAFLLGALFSSGIDANIYKVLGTGFCGGFTTFSTLNVEQFVLLEEKRMKDFAQYFLATYVLGFLACVVGMWVGKNF